MSRISARKKDRGFLLVTVLLVCTLLITLGLLLCTHAWYDLREASRTAGEIQGDLLVYSALVYYNTRGVPPREDEQPRKIFPFPDQRGEYFTLTQEGDDLIVVGVVRKGSVAVRRAYRVPLWETTYSEKIP